MMEVINDFVPRVALRDRTDPWWSNIEASDDFLDRLFAAFYERLGLPNLMRKSDYHALARFVAPAIDAEVIAVLDRIVRVAERAKPAPDVGQGMA
ncbi:MAG: hypothetical protein U0531_01695 [Dehalococcoidia bacterium]